LLLIFSIIVIKIIIKKSIKMLDLIVKYYYNKTSKTTHTKEKKNVYHN